MGRSRQLQAKEFQVSAAMADRPLSALLSIPAFPKYDPKAIFILLMV